VARVVIEHLTKNFIGARGERIPAVQDLSLTIEAKDLLVLAGPSGSGKTTTLRLLAGLEAPDGGRILVNDRPLNGVPPKERDMVMVFQNAALYPHMSVRENMAFGLKLRRVPRQEIARRVEQAAAMLGLNGCLERLPASLSAGQRQRVALGRAMVRQAGVCLYDEPLSNLDAPTRAQLRAEILRVHEATGASGLYVTHDQFEAMALGHRLAVIKDGMLQQVGQPLTIYERPTNLLVARFFGSPPMNLFAGTITAEGKQLYFTTQAAGSEAASGEPLRLRIESAREPGLAKFVQKPVVCGLRPEHVRIGDPGFAKTGGETWHGILESIEPTGPEKHVYLRLGNNRLVSRVPAGQPVEAGQNIHISFDMLSARFFDGATEQAICES
jgi:multiple sugar transport system ATP-binding protein